MSISLGRRIFETLLVAVLMFMFMSVSQKVLQMREDWLSSSIMWSTGWAFGHFIALSVRTMPNKSIKHILLVDLAIIFVIGVVAMLILHVAISLPTWKEVLSKTVVPFSISLMINSANRADD